MVICYMALAPKQILVVYNNANFFENIYKYLFLILLFFQTYLRHFYCVIVLEEVVFHSCSFYEREAHHIVDYFCDLVIR